MNVEDYILEDYPIKQRIIISKYLDEVKYNGENEVVIQCLAPVIVRSMFGLAVGSVW